MPHCVRRELTQVELAEKLGINQASVSAIENNSDLLLSTLAKYVRALGGDVEIRAAANTAVAIPVFFLLDRWKRQD